MTSGAWWDYRRAQPRFRHKSCRIRRPTQADVLLAILRYARANDRAVELPDLMCAGILQHEARLDELRAQGFVVVHKRDRHDGAMRSRYRLTFDPELELAR